jgi:hypothetical protein
VDTRPVIGSVTTDRIDDGTGKLKVKVRVKAQ